MLSKYFKDSKDKVDFYIAIVVIAMAGLLIGYFSFDTSDFLAGQSTKSINTPEKIDTLEVAGRTYFAVNTIEEETTSPSKTKKLHTRNNEGINAFSENAIDTTNATTQTTAAKEKNYADDEPIDDTTEIPSGEETAGETVNTENAISDTNGKEGTEPDNDVTTNTTGTSAEQADIIEETDTNEQTITDETTQEEKQPVAETEQEAKSQDVSRDCIIIIGSYKSAKNVAKLIGRLDRHGYPVFKAKRKGLTRVGIFEDCNTVNETLKNIRRKYSKDAFIMKAG